MDAALSRPFFVTTPWIKKSGSDDRHAVVQETWLRGSLTRKEPFAVACEEPINMFCKKYQAETQLSGDMNGTGLFL